MRDYRHQITTRLKGRDMPSVNSLVNGAKDKRPAAVLVGVIDKPQPEILLTRRAEHLSSHAGQVAFPGGFWEEQDENLIATALREAQEEVNLDPTLVDISGSLEIHHTGYQQPIIPVVGFIDEGADFRASLDEVSEIFSVPLEFLMERKNYQQHQREWNGRVWDYEVVMWEGRQIWGATASILRSLHQLVFV